MLNDDPNYADFLIYHIFDDDSKAIVNIKSYFDIDSCPDINTFVKGMKSRPFGFSLP